MDRKWSAAFLGTALAAIAALLGGCGGDSSGSSSGVSGADQSPLVARTDPPNNGAVYLNQPIRVEFTQEIDLGSVDSNSFAFLAYDLLDRYPAAEGHFVYDLETAEAREALWKDSQGRHLARPLVLVDVLFNLAYDPANPAVPLAGASLAPDAQLPELRFLVLPFRF